MSIVKHFSVDSIKSELWNKKRLNFNDIWDISDMNEISNIRDDKIAPMDLRPNKIKWLFTNKFIKSYWHYFSFYRILFILCEYIVGIILFYLYDSVFLKHTIASNKLNICIYICKYIHIYIFHKIRAIPLVLAQLSGNCPLIIEPFKNSENSLKYLILH